MEEQSGNNKNKIIIYVLAIVLLILFVVFIIQRSHLTKLVKEKETEKTELQKELDSVIQEHNKTKAAYGQLADSLKMKDSLIQANAIEIRKLIDSQWEFNKIRKKLARLQTIAQGYVRQMDSLYTINRDLQVENEKIRQDFHNEQSKSRELVKDKEALTEKVNQAAILRAYGIIVTPLKVKGGDKEQPTDKATRTDRLRICFTIGENPLIKSGEKIIYVRITRPDNVVVIKSKYDTFTFNGQTIPYSLRQDIAYQGKAMNICLNWTKKDTDKPSMKGKYTVSVFSDDKEIGTGSFDLK
jgi:hypothetical protein